MSDAPDFTLRSGKEPDTTIPRFFVEAVRNNRRSEEEGRPCFDDVEMVEILIPADRTSSWFGMVSETHRRRWPQHYAAFKRNEDGAADGTPLKELPGMTRSQIEELHHMHVNSVETLSLLSDEQLGKAVSMGGFALRDKAKRWLDQVAGSAAEEKLAAENRQKDARINELEGQMADLKARIDAMPAAAPTQT